MTGRRRVGSVVAALAAALVLLTGCSVDAAPRVRIPAEPFVESGTGEATVELSRINDRVWVHTSYAQWEGDVVGSNGLVVATDTSLVLIDTPWTPEQTAVLDGLIQDAFGAEISAAIVTHAHPDRMGGAPYLREAGIPITSLEIVAERAAETGYVVPDDVRSGDRAELTVGGATFTIDHPGAGHTTDNLVVWIADHRVLFGGCLVKEERAVTLGNTNEADVVAWPRSLELVAERYPDADVVVPGHGAWGDLGLIDHTRGLFDDA